MEKSQAPSEPLLEPIFDSLMQEANNIRAAKHLRNTVLWNKDINVVHVTDWFQLGDKETTTLMQKSVQDLLYGKIGAFDTWSYMKSNLTDAQSEHILCILAMHKLYTGIDEVDELIQQLPFMEVLRLRHGLERCTFNYF